MLKDFFGGHSLSVRRPHFCYRYCLTRKGSDLCFGPRTAAMTHHDHRKGLDKALQKRLSWDLRKTDPYHLLGNSAFNKQSIYARVRAFLAVREFRNVLP